jgi:hypothetical protein
LNSSVLVTRLRISWVIWRLSVRSINQYYNHLHPIKPNFKPPTNNTPIYTQKRTKGRKSSTGGLWLCFSSCWETKKDTHVINISALTWMSFLRYLPIRQPTCCQLRTIKSAPTIEKPSVKNCCSARHLVVVNTY